MTNWVVDKGITKLFTQINEAAPHRSKASDGTIGDAAHQQTDSDHNPEHPAPAGNPDQQVDAGDYTHDPAHGADMGVVSESIRESKDKRVEYVIFNKRIFSGPDGPEPFVWRPYEGSDPHTNHMHVSVRDSTHDQDYDWKIGIAMTTPDDFIQALWEAPVPGTGTEGHPKDRTLPVLLDDLQIRVQNILEIVEGLQTSVNTTPQPVKGAGSGGAPGA